MNLSPVQFKRLAQEAALGGFSVIPKGPQAGLPPKNRFMVGQRDVPEGMGRAGAATIRKYAEANAPTLDKPERYLGGWTKGGKTSLDVPRGYPTTPTGEVAARKSTLRNTQKAYGHMGPQRDYQGDVYNPFHPAFQDPFFGEHDPKDFEPSMYFAGDRRLWTQQPLLRQGKK
jgi:hypothetical protein